MNKAMINVSVSGIRNSLMHLEARKPGHPATLFVTWCRVSEDNNRYHYGWQLMRDNTIQAGDVSDRTVTHEELGENIKNLIENTFIEPFKHVDQTDFMLMN